MNDGALIIMQYCFSNNAIVKHRLIYLPRPFKEENGYYEENHGLGEHESYFVDENLDEYEPYTENGQHSSFTEDYLLITPIRFDFDVNVSSFTSSNSNHPISHFSIGAFENCRIPVCSALTPYQFLSFIIQNFYEARHCQGLCVYPNPFNNVITTDESKKMHFNYL